MRTYLNSDSTTHGCKEQRPKIHFASTSTDCQENTNYKLDESAVAIKNSIDSEIVTSLHNEIHDSKTAAEDGDLFAKMDPSYIVLGTLNAKNWTDECEKPANLKPTVKNCSNSSILYLCISFLNV